MTTNNFSSKQISYLLSNLIGCSTYMVCSNPSNFQFGGLTLPGLDQEAIDEMTSGIIALYNINGDCPEDVDRAIEMFGENNVDLSNFTYVLTVTNDENVDYILLWGDITYDIHFNDENKSNNKGFKQTFEYCKNYIEQSNGTGESYFEDYKNGTVSIVCNETSETVFETEVRTPLTIDLDEYPYAVAFETSTNYILNLKSGMGEAEYPKDQFSLDEAIADQVSMNIE